MFVEMDGGSEGACWHLVKEREKRGRDGKREGEREEEREEKQ
jgi:hypothetical protein